MPMYKTCPQCGAHLDPGERCDCQDTAKDAPDAPGTPSTKSGSHFVTSVTHRAPNVNLREIHTKDKDYALLEQRTKGSGCQPSRKWPYEVASRDLREGMS